MDVDVRSSGIQVLRQVSPNKRYVMCRWRPSSFFKGVEVIHVSCCSTRDRSVTVVCPSMSMDSTSLSWVWIYPHSSRLGYVFGSGLKNTSSQLRSRYFVVTPPSTNFRLYSTQMFGGKDESPTLREYRERLILRTTQNPSNVKSR